MSDEYDYNYDYDNVRYDINNNYDDMNNHCYNESFYYGNDKSFVDICMDMGLDMDDIYIGLM